MLRFAFIGFRHSHILSLYQAVAARPGLEVVASCEEHEPTRTARAKSDDVEVRYDDIDQMLREVACDVIAIGDYFQKRGSVAIRALRAGRHVITDKPVCTDLAELAEIRRLAHDRGLAVGCQLDLRDHASLQTLRKVIQGGRIGEVQTVSFSAQHPLNLATRPQWYFQEGRHGGTLNDLAIHGLDAIEWLTGRRVVEIVAARAWNARCHQHPHFQDGGQLMLRLDNGGGVLGDVSYLAPDKCGYTLPQYWRFTIHGDRGMVETSLRSKHVTLVTQNENPRKIPAEPSTSETYLDDFLREVQGKSIEDGRLSTPTILRASELALTTQKAADEGRQCVPCD